MTNEKITSLMINICEDHVGPLFKAATFSQTFDLRESGQWAPVLFKVIEYSINGKEVTVYPRKYYGEDKPLYVNPGEDLLVNMASCTAQMAPARMLVRSMGLDDTSAEVYMTGHHFDDADNRARILAVFHRVETPSDPEGTVPVTFDPADIEPHEVESYYSYGHYPGLLELGSFGKTERDLVVAFVAKARLRMVKGIHN